VETLENNLDLNLRVLRVVFMLIKICFMSHILGCFWYYVATLSGDGVPTWTQTFTKRVGISNTFLYLTSVYWAVTTLTTVGYGDISPSNDFERSYALFAMLLAALVFGYTISNIGSLVASLDRQAALLEEKTDAVKEYIAWRKLPRELSLRIKKHFSFFYTRRAAFDEVELLNGLSPSLRSEVTRFVLKETLGRIPLFSQQLDPDFQLEVFPLLKPVSYEKGEIVMRRGEPSRDLLFLLTGAIHFLSSIDQTVDSVFTPIEETFLVRHHLAVEHGALGVDSANSSLDVQRPGSGMSHTAEGREDMALQLTPREPLCRREHAGCFGESVLTGARRPVTAMAAAWSETLVLGREDLKKLFEANPRIGLKVTAALLATSRSRQRLHSLVLSFLIRSLTPGSRIHAALILQKYWGRFARRMSVPLVDYEGLLTHRLTSAPASRQDVEFLAAPRETEESCVRNEVISSAALEQTEARMTALFDELRRRRAALRRR